MKGERTGESCNVNDVWRIHEAGPKRLLARSWQCLKCRRRKLTNTGPVL